jgi:hypothetical protein
MRLSQISPRTVDAATIARDMNVRLLKFQEDIKILFRILQEKDFIEFCLPHCRHVQYNECHISNILIFFLLYSRTDISRMSELINCHAPKGHYRVHEWSVELKVVLIRTNVIAGAHHSCHE